MFKKLFVLVMLSVASSASFSADKLCGPLLLNKVYVQADRISGSAHANKLLLSFEGCDGVSLAYLENTDEAYDGVLSLALAAYISKQAVRILMDDSADASGAKRIQYINLQ